MSTSSDVRTSSRNVWEGITGTHDFEVVGYSLIDGFGVGKYVCSGGFSVGGHDWKVAFYPNGHDEDCAGYASAYLSYCGKERRVRAKYMDTWPIAGVEVEGWRGIASTGHLLAAADRYGLERLRLMCEEKLHESIDVDNAADVLALAERHHCSQLRDACVAFIASPSTLGPVLASNGFGDLMASCASVTKEILHKVSELWSGHGNRNYTKTRRKAKQNKRK